MVILDRETGIGQLVFEEAQAAHLGVVVHAEHFSVNQTDDNYILWNNYYEYQFTNADKVDFFIVATDRQKEILQEQFRRYTNHDPKSTLFQWEVCLNWSGRTNYVSHSQ